MSRDSDHYQDEAYAFFQNCYHLKDWLKHDPATSALAGDVEGYITKSLNLRLWPALQRLKAPAPDHSAREQRHEDGEKALRPHSRRHP